jgi:membrane-bound ClpP family serine protease
MRIGASLVLIAVGAILRFAVTVNNPHGFNIHTAGIILIIVGAIGLVASLIWMAASRRRTEVVEGAPPVGSSRRTYVDSPPPSY